jgi:hypothetical protein
MNAAVSQANEVLIADAPPLYRRSGKVSPFSLTIAALLLVPLGVLLGAAYSAAVVYLPFIKLRGLITFFFGVLLGAIAGRLCYSLKYRSGMLTALTVIGFASVAYYTCWAVHPALVLGPAKLQDGFVPLLLQGFDPRVIWWWMNQVFQEGIWQVGAGGGALSGWAVVVVWLIECGVIYAMAFVTGMGAYGNTPFCEHCHRWNNETEDLAVLPVSTTDPAWNQIRNGNFDALKKLQVVSGQQNAYVELRLAECPTCDESDFLSAIGIHLEMNDGQLKKKENDIFRHLSISRQQHDEILAFAEAMAEAVKEMNATEFEQASSSSDEASAGKNSAEDWDDTDPDQDLRDAR